MNIQMEAEVLQLYYCRQAKTGLWSEKYDSRTPAKEICCGILVNSVSIG